MPRQIGIMRIKVRELVSKAISRGKIDVYITYTNYGSDSKHVTIDEQLAKASDGIGGAEGQIYIG